MGLSNFPAAASDGLLPALVMNTVLFSALIFRSLLRTVGFIGSDSGYYEDVIGSKSGVRERRILDTQYKFLPGRGGGGDRGDAVECCVCLCRFEAEEHVSELFCRHLFHRACLDKWFDCYDHVSCPLCRSIC